MRESSTRPIGPHQIDEGVDLVARAGDFEDETLERGVDHFGAEDLRDAQRFDPVLAGGAHFHQSQFAQNASGIERHVDDLAHRDDAIELRLDLVDGGRFAGVTTVMRDVCAAVSVSATVRLSML